MLHLNIGPSALALGLLIPITDAAGFTVCVVGRSGESNPKVYGITGLRSGEQLEFQRVAWFEGPSVATDLPADVLARIEDGDEPLLITSSLRGAIAARCSFIEEVLNLRPKGAETIVLPCENSPASAYSRVKERCEQTGALMLRTVVNRMCKEHDRDSDNRRNVSVHPLAEWLVERPPQGYESGILTALSAVEGFETVDDIDARHDRKLWLVNGAHQALALMVRRANADHRIQSSEDLSRVLPVRLANVEAGEDDLRDGVHDPVSSATLGFLLAAMIEALGVVHPRLQGSFEYALKHVRAYSEHEDSAGRVLEAFRRSNLVPFLKALNERIGVPARVCFEHGRSVDAFKFVIDLFLELSANIDAYQDNADIRRHGISGEHDDAAVAAFRTLISPWMDDSIERRTGYFEQILAEQRAAFS